MQNMKRSREFQGSPKSNWLVTYADLMTLILVLFVLLFSFSQVDRSKLKSVVDSFNNRSLLGSQGDKTVQIDKKTEEQLLEVMKNEKEIQKIIETVSQFSKDNKIDLSVQRTKLGIEIVMPEVMSFDSGKADLLVMTKSLLDKIAPLLRQIPNEIRLEGHTDNVPIANAKFPTNWELSAARASAIARYLIDRHHLDPGRFVVTGYGEYRPSHPNNTEEGRRKNRRVVLIIANSNTPSSAAAK